MALALNTTFSRCVFWCSGLSIDLKRRIMLLLRLVNALDGQQQQHSQRMERHADG
jgi:hypothetical protein